MAVQALFVWIGSRCEFILLDQVAANSGDIEQPWTGLATQGNSLFLMKFLVSLVGTLYWLAGLVLFYLLYLKTWINHGTVDSLPEGSWPFLIIVVLVGVLLMLVILLVTAFIHNFVIPIMYAQRIRVLEAFSKALGLFSASPGVFVLYLLMRLVLVMAAMMVSTFVGCLSMLVCIGCIPIIGQYLVTVATLPVWVFLVAYSAAFMEQFGPEYKVFTYGEIILEQPQWHSQAPPQEPPS